MGQAESTTHDDDHHQTTSQFDDIDTLGYRILGVQPNSPAAQAGLVSFLDFLLGCDGKMLLGTEEDEEDVDFVNLLRESVGMELELLVFNIKSKSTRLVRMTPSSNWGGNGLLGVTIRLDNYAAADERLIRVLSIIETSPAEIAGLVPLKDYLLGTATESFSSDQVLSEVLFRNEEKVVDIYVYNTESDMVRVVKLMPTFSWGGAGLLGAEVGTGYLHRLPHKCRDTNGMSLEMEGGVDFQKIGTVTKPVAAVKLMPVAEIEVESVVDSTSETVGNDETVKDTPGISTNLEKELMTTLQIKSEGKGDNHKVEEIKEEDHQNGLAEKNNFPPTKDELSPLQTSNGTGHSNASQKLQSNTNGSTPNENKVPRYTTPQSPPRQQLSQVPMKPPPFTISSTPSTSRTLDNDPNLVTAKALVDPPSGSRRYISPFMPPPPMSPEPKLSGSI